jgi:signal peptidase II
VPARNDLVLLVSAACLIAAVDQATKTVVVNSVGPDQAPSRLASVSNWIGIEYSENQGAAFGIFAGATPILAIVSIAVMIGLLGYYAREERPALWLSLALGAIAGGAVGNFIDRVSRGFVVDFISVGAWPNFNVADSAITIGVLILAWGMLRPDSGSVSTNGISGGGR